MAAVLGRGIKGALTGSHNDGIGEIYDEDNHRRKCLKSTFAGYYIVTITLNGVAVVAGIFSQLDFHYSNHSARYNNVDSWYLANAMFGVLHILAAIYIVYKIEQPINYNKNYNGTRAVVYHGNNHPGFDYNHFDGEAPPPPPQNPNFVQANEVTVVRMDKNQRAPTASFPHAPPRLPPKMLTEPLTKARMKRVLCEDKIVAVYILVFVIYLAWHYFMDFQHMSYRYHRGMMFVMHCADVFIMAGPASLLFSCVYTIATRTNA